MFSAPHFTKKGISLVLCVSVMMILSMMAVAFARMMTYEQAAAHNYVSIVDARLAAFAGVERAKAVLWNSLATGTAIPNNFWYPHRNPYPNPADQTQFDARYRLETAAYHDPKADTATHLSLEANYNLPAEQTREYNYSGTVGDWIDAQTRRGRYEFNGNTYALKIMDPQGKLNISSHDTENYGTPQQTQANNVMNSLIRELAKQCGIDTTQTGTDGLVDYVRFADYIRPLDDKKPPPISSLQEIKSLVDQKCSKSTVDARRRLVHNLTVDSWIDPSTKGFTKGSAGGLVTLPAPPLNSYGTYYKEKRAPVNVNTASRNLLAALIANIRATVYMYHSDMAYTSESYSTQGSPAAMQNETRLAPDYWRLQLDFSAKAATLADRIYNQIHPGTDRPLKYAGELEAILDTTTIIQDSDLPAPSSGKKLTNFNTVSESSLGWVTGTPAYSSQWYQACRDALKANFNPNYRLNFWNPNEFSYRFVTKADLYAVKVSGGTTTLSPGYTTEFCYWSQGRLEVYSLGRISNQQKTRTVSSAMLRTVVKFCEFQTHTTQEDFRVNAISGYPTFTNSISYPEPSLADTNMGWIEPKAQLQGTLSSGNELHYFQASELFGIDDSSNGTVSGVTNKIPDTISKIQHLRSPASDLKLINATKPSINLGTSVMNHIVPDGMLSKTPMYLAWDSGTNSYIYKYRYYTANTIGSVGSVGTIAGRSTTNDNAYSNSKLGNYQGSIEFWVKLDVPGNSETVCGLVSFTQLSNEKSGIRLVKDPVTNKTTPVTIYFREGVQTHLFKSGLGKLRLSRIYFGAYFDSDGNYYGSYSMADGDPSRKYAKREAVWDISSWKAHRWYHLLVTWDDTSSTLSSGLSMFVNGAKVAWAQYYLGNPSAQEFCVINEKSPANASNIRTSTQMDGLFLNGFYREQYDDQIPQSTFRYAMVITHAGNATIDGVRTYKASLNGLTSFTPTRFSNASYQNIIKIAYPGMLGPLYWTSYPPRPSTPGAAGSYITCSTRIRPTNAGTFVTGHTPTSDSTQPGYYGDGLPAASRIPVTPDHELEYTANFYTGTWVDRCAALDSVTILIFVLRDILWECIPNEDQVIP